MYSGFRKKNKSNNLVNLYEDENSPFKNWLTDGGLQGKDGYDKYGYDKNGYDKDGYDHFGWNQWGFGKDGYNKYGIDMHGNSRIK